MAASPKDHFSLLPNDITLHIIAYLPLSGFFDLTHTSQHLRSILKANAATLCNTIIRKDPILAELSAKLGVSTTDLKANDWIGPHGSDKTPERPEGHITSTSNDILCSRLLRYGEFTKIGTFVRPSGNPEPSQALKVVWNKAGLKMRPDERGPQFLCLLQWVRQEQGDTGVQALKKKHIYSLYAEWIMSFLTPREEDALRLKGYSDRLPARKLPRELIWYHGLRT